MTWEKVLPERHDQRVFAFVIITEAILLLICVIALSIVMFFDKSPNTEAMTALVALTNWLLGSFGTLLAARGIVNGKPKDAT